MKYWYTLIIIYIYIYISQICVYWKFDSRITSKYVTAKYVNMLFKWLISYRHFVYESLDDDFSEILSFQRKRLILIVMCFDWIFQLDEIENQKNQEHCNLHDRHIIGSVIKYVWCRIYTSFSTSRDFSWLSCCLRYDNERTQSWSSSQLLTSSDTLSSTRLRILSVLRSSYTVVKSSSVQFLMNTSAREGRKKGSNSHNQSDG